MATFIINSEATRTVASFDPTLYKWRNAGTSRISFVFNNSIQIGNATTVTELTGKATVNLGMIWNPNFSPDTVIINSFSQTPPQSGNFSAVFEDLVDGQTTFPITRNLDDPYEDLFKVDASINPTTYPNYNFTINITAKNSVTNQFESRDVIVSYNNIIA